MRSGPSCAQRLQLRPLRDGDVETVVALWRDTWHENMPGLRHPHAPGEWEQRFRDDVMKRCVVWVAQAEGQILGFVAVRLEDGYLDQLFVVQQFQRRGVGTLLLGKARELCPRGLSLHTLHRNTKARQFYEKHGFRPGRKGINVLNGQPNIEYRWLPE